MRNEDIPGQGSCGKLQRGVENPLERTRLDYHNMQISDHQYVNKVFENLRHILRLNSKTLDAKTKRTDLVIIDVDNDEIISSSRASTPRELGCMQLRGAQDVVRYNIETNRGTIIRDPKCIYDDMHFLSLDEIYSVS